MPKPIEAATSTIAIAPMTQPAVGMTRPLSAGVAGGLNIAAGGDAVGTGGGDTVGGDTAAGDTAAGGAAIRASGGTTTSTTSPSAPSSIFALQGSRPAALAAMRCSPGSTAKGTPWLSRGTTAPSSITEMAMPCGASGSAMVMRSFDNCGSSLAASRTASWRTWSRPSVRACAAARWYVAHAVAVRPSCS